MSAEPMTFVQLRLRPELVSAVDAYRRGQERIPTFTGAIMQLLCRALDENALLAHYAEQLDAVPQEAAG